MGLWLRTKIISLLRQSIAARARFEQTGDLAALHEAITSAEQAVANTSPGDPVRASALSTLGLVLRLRFERLGAEADLMLSCECAEQAVAAAGPDHDDWALFQGQLGVVKQRVYELSGDVGDLERAIAASETAVAATAHDHPSRPGRLANLSNVHRMKYERFGDRASLNRAIDIGVHAVAATPKDSAVLPLVLTALGVARQQRFELTGDSSELDEALDIGERAVEATPVTHPELAGRLSNLALAYHKRYRHTGSTRDLDRAVEFAERAVAETAPNHPDRAMYQSNLSIVLRRRAERTGSLPDLQRAVGVAEQAVDATADGPADRLKWQSTLLNAYRALHAQTGDLTVLDRAIAIGERILVAAPSHHPHVPGWLSNLGILFLTKYQQTTALADLDRAVTLGELAVAGLPPDHPTLMPLTAQLYETYQRRFEATGHRVPRDELLRVVHWLENATLFSASHRVQLGHVVGTVANAMGEHAVAVTALDSAVRALPSVAPRELSRGDQEYALGDHAGLVSEAIAAHLAVDDPVSAVEAAELGRGVLIAAALESPSEWSALSEVDAELATRARWARDRLDRPDEELTLVERRQRSDHYHELLRQVRALSGLSRFLLPPALDALRPQGDGVVVVVNASQYRGDAIVVVSDGDPLSIPLPRLRRTDARSWVEQLRAVTAANGSLTGALRARRIVTDLLSWLWDTTVGLVVEMLPTEPPSRIWWIPVGPLGLLPLHAAGHPGKPGALDRVRSSYIPSLRALTHTRNRPGTQHRTQLTVAMATTPGLAPLPGTAAEATTLANHAPHGLGLADDTATTRRVLDALATSTWAHFACHASMNLAAPSQGGLHLHDGILPIATINDIRLGQGELAYLSACSTAQTGWRHADESIHMASAFQLAGYRHVVASLWPLADSVAAAAARSFYDQLPDLPSSNDIASALHHVVRQLRDEHVDRPDLWASLVHSGP